MGCDARADKWVKLENLNPLLRKNNKDGCKENLDLLEEYQDWDMLRKVVNKVENDIEI